jgi:hypothetical protein
MITQDVLNRFIDAFNPTPEEIAMHPIELIPLSGGAGWGAICQQMRTRREA